MRERSSFDRILQKGKKWTHKIKIIEIEEKIQIGRAEISEYFELGTNYLMLGKYSKLFDLYAKLKLKQLSNIEMARVYHEEGEAFWRYGRDEEAKALFEKSLKLLISTDDSFEYFLWKGLNHYNLFQLEYDQDLSRNHVNEALKCFNLLIDNFPPDDDDHKIHSIIADIYFRLENHEKTLASYETALQLATDDRDKIWILTGIASSYGMKKEYEIALKYFREAMQKAEITKTPASKIHYDMGVLFFENNRLDDAKNAFHNAMEGKLNDPLLREDSIYDIGIFWHLGTIAYEMQDDENIVAYLSKVLKMIKNNHYYFANTHLTLGHYYARESDYEKAREHYNQVLIAPRAAGEEIEMAKTCLAKIPLDS